MTLVADIYEAYDATFEMRGGIEVVNHYGRPGRTHRATRDGVDVIGYGYDVVVVGGGDRVNYVDNVMTNTVPDKNGEDVYVLPLDSDDRIETEMCVYNASERLLTFIPRDRAKPLVEEWDSRAFLQCVKICDASGEFGVSDVHGPQSTEKVASILSETGAPKPELSFARDSTDGELGITVAVSDSPTGEGGYDVICRARDAEDVPSALLSYGDPSVPVGYRTWDSLIAKAGTPLLESELRGNVPNVTGVRNALDFDKDCFIGQKPVSGIEGRGRPPHRLVGFHADALPDLNTEVPADSESVDTVTRAVEGPMLDVPIGFVLVGYSLDTDVLKVAVDGNRVEATRKPLPFVKGSAVSAQLPTYPGKNQTRCA